MLSGNHNIFIRPKTRRQEADDRKRAFNDYKVGRESEIREVIFLYLIAPFERRKTAAG